MPLITTPDGSCNHLVYHDAGFPCDNKNLLSDIWLRSVYATWTGDVEFWRKWVETIDPPVGSPYQNKFMAKVHTATHHVVRSEYRYLDFRHQYYGRDPWWRDNNGDNLDYPWFNSAQPRCPCIPIVNGTNADWLDDPTWTNQDPPGGTIVLYSDSYGTWPIYYVRVILDVGVWADPITKIADTDFRTMSAQVYIRIHVGNSTAQWQAYFQRGKYTLWDWTTNIAHQIPENCDIVIGDYDYIQNSSSSADAGYWHNSFRVVNDPGTLTIRSVDII